MGGTEKVENRETGGCCPQCAQRGTLQGGQMVSSMDVDLAPASPDVDAEVTDMAVAFSGSQRARGFRLGEEQEEKESWS